MMRAVAMALACTLVFPAGVAAERSRRDDWHAVLVLAPEAPIKLKSRDGRTIIGSFVAADAGSILVHDRLGVAEMLSRDDVREIRMRPVSPLRAAGRGAVSGFWLAARVVGPHLCHDPCSREFVEVTVGLSGALGVIPGSILGFGVGVAKNLRPGKLIYRRS